METTWKRRKKEKPEKAVCELAIYFTIMAVGPTYLSRFAKQFQVSQRTVYRYVEDLKYCDNYVEVYRDLRRSAVRFGFREYTVSVESLTKNGRMHIDRLQRLLAIVEQAMDSYVDEDGERIYYEFSELYEDYPNLFSKELLMDAAKTVMKNQCSVRTLERDVNAIMEAKENILGDNI